ncbi:lamin tail domain-containing protein, partial [Planctomycetota bacterium]
MRCTVRQTENLEPRTLLCSVPVVTEFQASVASDEKGGNSPDWIEVYNPCATSLSLHSFYLSDNVDVPRKWRFPEGLRLRPGEFFVVYASGDNVVASDGTVHADFSLDADGESVILASSSEIVDQV